MTMSYECEACGTQVEGADLEALGDAFIAHVRSGHPDWPYPDLAIRNFAEATQRLSGRTERLATLGAVTMEPVTAERLDDWLAFFDHDAFADNPAWAACYCSEPHLHPRGTPPEEAENRSWRQSREVMCDLLCSERAFGYLAYVDGRPAAWVNASKRVEYALYRLGEGADPADGDVVGISCFVVAPPYRRHGLANQLLDRVLADAPSRGVAWIEAYPFNGEPDGDAPNFRGPRPMYDARGFEPVEDCGRYTVMRRRS